jgi:hypothetical protein
VSRQHPQCDRTRLVLGHYDVGFDGSSYSCQKLGAVDRFMPWLRLTQDSFLPALSRQRAED